MWHDTNTCWEIGIALEEIEARAGLCVALGFGSYGRMALALTLPRWCERWLPQEEVAVILWETPRCPLSAVACGTRLAPRELALRWSAGQLSWNCWVHPLAIAEQPHWRTGYTNCTRRARANALLDG